MTEQRSRQQVLLPDIETEFTNDFQDEKILIPFDPTAPDGFRLHRLEILNWGTFHEQVHVFYLDGETSLLVGQNGSGKSTLVDAVLTLLVPSAIRNYNVAAGAKKRERSEVSYIQGACGQFGDEDDLKTKTRYLRAKSKKPTILLACFRNASLNQIVTLAQIQYLDTEGRTAQHVYCFDTQERRIQDDLYPIDPSDRIISKLKDKGFSAWREFVDYQKCFTKAFHLKEKAMDVFNQTVAVKDIQKLDTFIREHMLDSVSWKEKTNPVIAHFADLKSSYESLVRVQSQQELLVPIRTHGAKYRQIEDEYNSVMGIFGAVDVFEACKTLDFAIPMRQQFQEELESVKARLTDLKNALHKSRQAKSDIEVELAGVGGEKRQLLETNIAHETESYENKQKAYRFYHGLLEEIGIKERVDTSESFVRVQEQIRRKAAEFQGRHTEGKNKRDELLIQRNKEIENRDKDKAELLALEQRQSNLPEANVAMRKQICLGLGIDEKTLPFAAELIAVLPEESEWESSIENLLHDFALDILVPHDKYEQVAGFVEKHRMLDHTGKGGILHYQRAGLSPKTPKIMANPNGVFVKLNIKRHTLDPWLKSELLRRFDYLCCEDMDTFRRATGQALTKNRHIKSGNKHRKDDRPKATDRGNFVLGWDNREKRRFLKERIDLATQAIAAYNKKIDEWDSTLTRLSHQTTQSGTLLTKQHFSEIDFFSHEESLGDLRKQLHQLISGNKTTQILEERKKKIEVEIEKQELEQETKTKRQGSLETDIEKISVIIEDCEETILKEKATGKLSVHETHFQELEVMLEEHFLNDMIGCRKRCREIKSDLQDRANRLKSEMEPIGEKIETAMLRYVRSFPEDKSDVSATVANLNGFENILLRIEKDDLPRHREKFREYLDDKVTQQLQILSGKLKNEQRQIRDKIEMLNTSLQQIDYRTGTFMRLEVRESNDPQIAEFRRKMHDCLDESFIAGFSSDEKRYEKLQGLIVEMEKEPAWTEKVVDVRRWFTFLARELDRETGASKETYEDSSGQSGGEKAKLAFTILVASIAYQYDIDLNSVPSDRFHFVMVDEMFSKIDDQFSEYALKLFEKFRLQLLIVAPLDAKARVTEPFVKRYLHVVKDPNSFRSRVYKMSAKEFEEYADEIKAN